MNNIKILIFDEEELTQTLIENYLQEVIFPFTLEKYNEFDEGLIENSQTNKIIIVNINTLNSNVLEKINFLSENYTNNFLIISYDQSTDLRVCALRSGVRDVILKPLIKSDFLFTINQIYKKYICEKDTNKNNLNYSVITDKKDSDKDIFIVNLAKEISDISNKDVLIINVPVLENYILPYFKFSKEQNEKYKNQLYKYPNSRLYLYNFDNVSVAEPLFTNIMNELQQDFKYILINISSEIPINIKRSFISKTNDILYFTSFEASGITIRENINNLGKNKKVKLIINKYKNKNIDKVFSFIDNINIPIYYTLPQNIMVQENAKQLKETFNEYNRNCDIEIEYINLAKKIMNRT